MSREHALSLVLELVGTPPTWGEFCIACAKPWPCPDAGQPVARSWDIRLPWTAVPLSLNDRGHWPARARRTRAVRDAAAVAALAAPGLARADLARCEVGLTYVPRDRRRRDADNLVATLKACCDGLVDAGVVADDTPDLMVKRMPVIAAPDGDPRLVLTIREVLDA